jgi:hypothetical protein
MCVAFWRSLGASNFLSGQIELEINDPPVVPFYFGETLDEIPQSEEDPPLGLRNSTVDEKMASTKRFRASM